MGDTKTDSRIARPEVKGERYQAIVPDTLDLADHARAAINVMTRAVIPEIHYAYWQAMRLATNPPAFTVPDWITGKWMESLPYMRKICGDDLNLDVEQAMMQTFVDHIGRDGLLWSPRDLPLGGYMPNTVNPLQCVRFMLAMNAWYERDGDDRWKRRICEMARGLDKLAIRRQSCGRRYAFFPPNMEASYAADGTWVPAEVVYTSVRLFPYTPVDEPTREQQGREGCVKFESGTAIRALVKGYEFDGDDIVLDLARQLSCFCRLPGMWEDTLDLGVAGYEHGHFAGHFHANTMSVRGLLDLAVLIDDQQGKELVREAYEHAKGTGIPRLGWFQGWVMPLRHGGHYGAATRCEGCAIGNMTALAVALTDAGLGDYFDDVDHFARNQLIEQQYRDLGRLKEIAEIIKARQPVHDFGSDPVDTDNVLGRAIGAFGEAAPTHMMDSGGAPTVRAYGCCTGNGSLGLYYAWEAIVRYRDGVANVNLLLNRASPWVDIDSYLPYEGRVVITVKDTPSVAVRIPGWVNIHDVRLTLDGKDVRSVWAGRYMTLHGLHPGQKIELQFDVPTDHASYLVPGLPSGRYNISFRGSTAVLVQNEVETSAEDLETRYLIYQRDHYRENKAPMREVTRFVSS